MAQSIIGALRVVLGADTAAFDRGLSKAEKRADRFSRQMKRAGAVIAAGLAAAAAGLAASVKNTAQLADDMLKTAQAVGTSTEELSRLTHAAEMSGSSFEQLSTGIRKFSQSIGDALEGGASEAVRAFDQLGVSVTDSQGVLKDTSQLISEVADKFSKMEDGARKTDIAMALFGRSGAKLIPMLNAGADGLARMKAEADAFGLTISEKAGRQAEAFNDNMARLRKIGQGIALDIGQKLLPHLLSFSETLLDASKNTDVLIKSLEPLIFILKHLLAAVIRIGAAFKGVAMDISAAGAAISQFVSGDFAGASKALTDGLAETQRFLDGADQLIEGILNFGTDAGSNVGDAVSRKAYDRIDAAFAGAVDGIKDNGHKISDAISEYFIIDPEMMTAPAVNAGRSAGRSFRAGIESVGDPWEGMREATDRMADDMSEFGRSVGGAISGLINKTSSWKDVLGDVARSLSKFILSGVNFGGGGGGGGFFKALLGGLFGFAQGGSFKVGGAGGIDSQVVAFKASPDETVHVTRPDQMVAAAGGKSTLELLLSPDLQVRILEAALGQSIQVVRQYDKGSLERAVGANAAAKWRGLA